VTHRFDWLGIRRDESELVRDEILRFFASPGLDVPRADVEGDRALLEGRLVVTKGDWCAVHAEQPLAAGGALCARLSRNLNAPTLWMRVPQDFWEYRLFIGGREVDRFSQVPQLSEPYAADPERWKGRTATLASAFGVTEAEIAKYLVQWPKEAWQRPSEYGEDTKRFSWGKKAHPDDEFPVSDYWVMCDFSRRIGLEYGMSAAKGLPIQL